MILGQLRNRAKSLRNSRRCRQGCSRRLPRGALLLPLDASRVARIAGQTGTLSRASHSAGLFATTHAFPTTTGAFADAATATRAILLEVAAAKAFPSFAGRDRRATAPGASNAGSWMMFGAARSLARGAMSHKNVAKYRLKFALPKLDERSMNEFAIAD